MMPVEVRDALDRAADIDEARPDLMRIKTRAAHYGQRRRLQRVVSVLATLAVVVGTVVILSSSNDEANRRVTVTPAASRPVAILTIWDGELVELSAQTGTVQRVITNLGPRFPGTTLATDGKVAYIDGAPPYEIDEARRLAFSHIAQVDLHSGAMTDVALGRRPTLSRDGRHLAFIEFDRDDRFAAQLVARDITTGDERRWATTSDTSPVAWMPDGQHLLVRTRDDFRMIDTGSTRSIERARVVATIDTKEGPLDLFPMGDTGRWVAVIPTNRTDTPRSIVEYDPETGAFGRELVRVDAGMQARNPSLTVTILDTDRSGRHLLYVVFPGVGTENGLYSWSAGQRQPAQLLPGSTFAVAWLPPPTGSQATGAAVETQLRDVVVFPDGRCFRTEQLPVPCDQFHTTEDYATFTAAGRLDPATGLEDQLAYAGCHLLFERYTGANLDDQRDYRILTATENGSPGRVATTCSITGQAGSAQPITGTARTGSPDAPDSNWKTYRDRFNGFSVEIPPGWDRDYSAFPSELLSVATSELVSECDGAAFTNAAFISVNEIRPAGSPDALPQAAPRPEVFGPDSGTIEPAIPGGVTVSGCAAGLTLPPTQSIFFIDGNRKIQITVRFYPEASSQRRAEAYEVLNSMRFDPASTLHRGRPAQEVGVFVVNGTGQPSEQGLSLTLNVLTGSGYRIAGTADTKAQPRTTVACIRRQRDDARAIARLIGPGTKVTTLANSATSRSRPADCIVTVGSRPASSPSR